MKNLIKTALNNFYEVKFRVSEKDIAKEDMDKKLFVESITLLHEIDDRRDFMESELGVDMSIYEEKFLQVIENLFKMHFNKEQLALIQYYLHTVPTLEEWDGKLDLSDGKETITVDFETPSDVWTVVSSLEKVKKEVGKKK